MTDPALEKHFKGHTKEVRALLPLNRPVNLDNPFHRSPESSSTPSKTKSRLARLTKALLNGTSNKVSVALDLRRTQMSSMTSLGVPMVPLWRPLPMI